MDSQQSNSDQQLAEQLERVTFQRDELLVALERAQEAMAAAIALVRAHQDPWVESLKAFLDRNAMYTTRELLQGCFSLYREPTRADQMRLAEAMRSLGWKSAVVTREGKKVRVYTQRESPAQSLEIFGEGAFDTLKGWLNERNTYATRDILSRLFNIPEEEQSTWICSRLASLLTAMGWVQSVSKDHNRKSIRIWRRSVMLRVTAPYSVSDEDGPF